MCSCLPFVGLAYFLDGEEYEWVTNVKAESESAVSTILQMPSHVPSGPLLSFGDNLDTNSKFKIQNIEYEIYDIVDYAKIQDP